VNYRQDDWARFLPFAEFESNYSVNASTSMSPFFATKTYQPYNGKEPSHDIEPSSPQEEDSSEPPKHGPEERPAEAKTVNGKSKRVSLRRYDLRTRAAPISTPTPTAPATRLQTATSAAQQKAWQAADSLVENMIAVRTFLQKQLRWAQEQMRKYADRKRVPAPEFKMGD